MLDQANRWVVQMATIIHSINATLNGSCSHTDSVVDAEHNAYAIDLLDSAEALLFGRTTFDLFAGFWPQAASNAGLPAHMVALGRKLGAVRKYVVSRWKPATDWNNTFHLSGPIGPEIENLRQSIEGNIVMFGSPGLAASMASANQIDEYHVLIQPFIVDSPPRLFGSVTTRLTLHLESVTRFASGVILAKYRPGA